MYKLIITRASMLSLGRNLCTPVSSSPKPNADALAGKYRPSNLQKIILVWTKKFKSKEEIPDYVSHELIQKSNSQARIKIANFLMFLTALASLGAILSGKAAATRGESVHQMNLDWHQQYNVESNKTNNTESK